MAEWQNGGMAEMAAKWRNGRMAGMATYLLFMVHANNDTDTFKSSLFQKNSYVFSIANFFWLVTYEFVVLNLYS